MKKKILLLSLLVFSTIAALSQSNGYIGVKISETKQAGYVVADFIRSENTNAHIDERVESPIWVFNANVIYTKFTNNNRFGFSGGLRYSRTTAQITNNRFYVFKENDNIYYYGGKDFTQNINYIGIPLEVDFVVTNPNAAVQLFFNVGLNFDFNVGSNTRMSLTETVGNTVSYSIKDLTNYIEKPSAFCFSTFVGMGMRIGRPNKVNGVIELDVPYYGYTQVGISHGRWGAGLSLGINIPLK